jgi:hypothetical protein
MPVHAPDAPPPWANQFALIKDVDAVGVYVFVPVEKVLKTGTVAPEEIVSLVSGLVTLIPTLPLEAIRIASAPPSEKAIVSAAGKKMPVLVSPVVVMAGAETVPAGTVVTPVAVNVPASVTFCEASTVTAVVPPVWSWRTPDVSEVAIKPVDEFAFSVTAIIYSPAAC